MCIIDEFNKTILVLIELITVTIIGVSHIVFGFLRKEPDFNTYDLFISSPFFDFSINDDCNNLSINVYHTWGGWKQKERDEEGAEIWVVYDVTNITKINGKYLCYKYISYKDLLNNGQIIKNGKECPNEYNKNCGRIDTLNQELCIKKNEKCPLYDVGIGESPNNISYIYDKNSNIYYNNDNFSELNKSIISKLILNEGQPCYHSTEKLWRQFSPIKNDETHLSCTNIQIFGKYNEDRYIEKGEITYKKLYEDNLNERAKNNTLNYVTENETVHLYKREFYGIDKKCDEQFNLIDNFNSFQNFQLIDKIIQLCEGFLITSGCFVIIILEIIFQCEDDDIRYTTKDIYFWAFIINIIVVSGCFIFHVIAYVNILKHDYSNYNCSDSVTNEIIKKGNENNKKVLTYNMICTFPDGIIIAGNLIVFVIGLILIKINEYKENQKFLNNNNDNNNNNDKQNSEEDETAYYDSSTYKINDSVSKND